MCRLQFGNFEGVGFPLWKCDVHLLPDGFELNVEAQRRADTLCKAERPGDHRRSRRFRGRAVPRAGRPVPEKIKRDLDDLQFGFFEKAGQVGEFVVGLSRRQRRTSESSSFLCSDRVYPGRGLPRQARGFTRSSPEHRLLVRYTPLGQPRPR